MNPEYRFPPGIRDVILRALPDDTSLHGASPELRYTYLPAVHAKALHPNNMLVVGIRGSGKSFWWAALQEPKHREVFGRKIGFGTQTKVSKGFGLTPAPDDYPGKDTLSVLIKKFDPRQIWRTVVFRHICAENAPKEFTKLIKWEEKVVWVKENPEETERFLFEIDKDQKFHHILVFDALDRTADDWRTMNKIVRGLLQTALDFRSYKGLRLKIFVRPDQIEDPEVTSFPDSSKVISEKAELYWPRNELYGLLWQHLANVDNGEIFRKGTSQLTNLKWDKREGVWGLSEPLRGDEELQRKLFHSITGPWMGRDRRRGFPYTWLPNHLGDTRKQVSPRSFLAAVRHASAVKAYQEYPYALHFENIKRGVQEASKIRVKEIEEDYAWVGELFKPLSAISVPCSVEEIKLRWRQSQAIEKLTKTIKTKEVRLPPPNLESREDGVLQDLAGLGLIEWISDDRINIPDVYRVGYGIGRRGGVKPAARG
jgi:hypothetical protein